MDNTGVKKILDDLLSGELSADEALQRFRHYPFQNLCHTRIDTHRELRSGFGEVVFAEGKEFEELSEIVSVALSTLGKLLITRIRSEHIEGLREKFPQLVFDERARVAHTPLSGADRVDGNIAVVSAGTSDSSVAREAARCAEFFGLEVREIHDVGIAGLPRLLESLPDLEDKDVLIVVAGMEGALPGVISGLCPAPVVAVPTSVGYGACFGGITALFSMLVSCSPGLSVVNIDNGFGAALASAKMIRHLRRTRG